MSKQEIISCIKKLIGSTVDGYITDYELQLDSSIVCESMADGKIFSLISCYDRTSVECEVFQSGDSDPLLEYDIDYSDLTEELLIKIKDTLKNYIDENNTN